MTHNQLVALTEMASAALVAIERLDAGRPAEEIFAWLRDAVDEHKVVGLWGQRTTTHEGRDVRGRRLPPESKPNPAGRPRGNPSFRGAVSGAAGAP